MRQNNSLFIMKIIPMLRCNDLKESAAFYTGILDFTLKYPDEADNEWSIDLINGDAEILLTSSDGTPRIAVYIMVDDVRLLFEKYVSRGLKFPDKPNSPVHHGPIDQTWGLKEFYVDDPNGNTLRFASPIV